MAIQKRIQVFPMSDDYLSNGQTIESFFTEDLITPSPHRPTSGRFNFKEHGVTAPEGSLLLFQYKAKLVAHAELLRRCERDEFSPAGSAGFFLLKLDTLRYYERPINARELQSLFPNIRFDQRKRQLDPSKREPYLHFANSRSTAA